MARVHLHTPVALEEDDASAPLGEKVGGRDPGDATANDRDVRVDILGEARVNCGKSVEVDQ
jgi:hypothetical protein